MSGSNQQRKQSRRQSTFVTESEPLPDLEAEEIPSHRCLILDRSFEALKSARSSTDAMRERNKELTERVHSEITKGEEYKQEVSDGTRFVFIAENDSVMKILRERDEQQDGIGELEKQSNQDGGEGREEENENEVGQEMQKKSDQQTADASTSSGDSGKLSIECEVQQETQQSQMENLESENTRDSVVTHSKEPEKTQET